MIKQRAQNAIILAAGLSSRFVPISIETPKPLINVKGEILIERQIRQLKAAGIQEITIVTGYHHEKFKYLELDYDVKLVYNPDYFDKNNHSSLFHVRDKLSNTYICSADNYFTINVFKETPNRSYYSSVYHNGRTDEYCIDYATNGKIKKVKVGGVDAWVMFGHAYLDLETSNYLIPELEKIYKSSNFSNYFWEDILINNLENLDIFIKKFDNDVIFEFDSIEQLLKYDKRNPSILESKYIKSICNYLGSNLNKLHDFYPLYDTNGNIEGFTFRVKNLYYHFDINNMVISIK